MRRIYMIFPVSPLTLLLMFLSVHLMELRLWAVDNSLGSTRVQPPGESIKPKTSTLEAGSKLLQSKTPLNEMTVYLNAFHPMKDDPELQMEAHHYCKIHTEDFAQCVLFDGNSRNANLNGIEYIVSEKLFNQLPKEERKYWHPHNYEILSGQLIAPGIPKLAEHELMKQKINSYGKTWHVWNTGHFGSKDGTQLPLGEPMIAWSFNRDNEAKPGLVEQRDQGFGIKSSDKRTNRQDLKGLATPQSGVNELSERFQRKTFPIPGIINNQEKNSN